MGTYHVAEVCPNGHVSTSSADTSPELREKFCSSCGESTMTQCPYCGSTIRGFYFIEGVFSFNEYTPPAHCHNCGGAFPWTVRKVEGAVELVEVGGGLTDSEIVQLRNDLTELTKDSPKMQVASLRFRKAMAKVGSTVAQGVRDVVVDVLSEAAKKSIWGG
jgi:hypothetical protein